MRKATQDCASAQDHVCLQVTESPSGVTNLPHSVSKHDCPQKPDVNVTVPFSLPSTALPLSGPLRMAKTAIDFSVYHEKVSKLITRASLLQATFKRAELATSTF